MLTRMGATFDYRARLTVATQFGNTNPQGASETEVQYMRRVQWHVLTTLGLPPIKIARHWVKVHGPEMGFIPPADIVERYLRERVNAPLPDGKPDLRVTNGESPTALGLALLQSKTRPPVRNPD